MSRPKIVRIAKLQGFDNVLVGRDFADVFEEGHVYSIRRVLGEIIVDDLGKHAQNERYKGSGLSEIMMTGSHLLTLEEFEKQNNR